MAQQSVYCPHCKHFLLKAELVVAEIKCRYCKKNVKLNYVSQEAWMKKYLT